MPFRRADYCRPPERRMLLKRAGLVALSGAAGPDQLVLLRVL